MHGPAPELARLLSDLLYGLWNVGEVEHEKRKSWVPGSVGRAVGQTAEMPRVLPPLILNGLNIAAIACIAGTPATQGSER